MDGRVDLTVIYEGNNHNSAVTLADNYEVVSGFGFFQWTPNVVM